MSDGSRARITLWSLGLLCSVAWQMSLTLGRPGEIPLPAIGALIGLVALGAESIGRMRGHNIN